MKAWQERYGEDRDGNRGRLTWFYEIDDSDEEEIKAQILTQLEDQGYDLGDPDDWPKEVTIRLINPYTEDDIDFEVNPKEYM